MTKESFNHPDSPELFLNIPLDEIKNRIQDFTDIQLVSLIRSCDNKSSQLKLLAVIEHSHSTNQLEVIGQTLSTKQFLTILENIASDLKGNRISFDKLSPLLVGLRSEIFCKSLKEGSELQLKTLKHEGLLEPLEKQILNLINYTEEILLKTQVRAQEIHQKIKELALTSIGYQTLHELQDEIEDLKFSLDDLIQILDQALAITWNTHRIDLIEKLSQLKEHVHFNLTHLVGVKSEPSTMGLNGILQKTLFDIYDENFKKSNIDEKAIDGLAKLSVWYLKDYWELGLLPHINNIQELEPAFKTVDEKLAFRQKIFDLVQENLNKLGLSTIGSLKKAEIFSKGMLKEYIKNNNDRLG